MTDWIAPTRPRAHAESALLAAILDGTFPPGTTLPGERTLAAQLGVTRPTLREALQRLAGDGWLTVAHGKPTLVNNYWEEGGLNVLGKLVAHPAYLPPDFIGQLLEVRLHLAPAYTRAAVAHDAPAVAAFLAGADHADREFIEDVRMLGHGVGEAGAVGDVGADLAEDFADGRVYRLPFQNLETAQQRHAGMQQVGELGVERREMPALNPLVEAPLGGGLLRLDAHRQQAAGVENRHRFPLAAGRQGPGVQFPVAAPGLVGELGHEEASVVL